jgi:DNA-directed RNA polymerase specialized sigma24 family protein
MTVENFSKFLEALRRGDEQAARELVRSYGPFLRAAIRLRLRDARLRRVFDSLDILQSVLGDFFTRPAWKQYPLRSPEDLCRLLTTLVQHKLADKGRRLNWLQEGLPEGWDRAAPQPSPLQQVIKNELLEAVYSRLRPRERWLVEARLQGRSWAEIAREAGENADRLRLRHARAIDRVREELAKEEKG